jgi:hypothetical protein
METRRDQGASMPRDGDALTEGGARDEECA